MIRIWRLWTFLICLAVVLSACGSKRPNPPTWQEQYDLGVRYLSEGNYEEAIIAFTAAIEIDPKRAEAYMGRGDAYQAQAELTEDAGDTQSLREMALADYLTALELGSGNAKEKLTALQVILENGDIPPDAQLKLETLNKCFASGDLEGAKAFMRQEDYRQMSNSLSGNSLTYMDRSGSCTAVYPDNYYYYGDWADGQRSGRGLWIRAVFEDDSDLESYTYEGMWANDLPNGEGHIVRNRDPDKIQLEPGRTTSVTTEITGTFANGLYHGIIYEVWNMNSGSVMTWSPIPAVNGVYQPMEEVPDFIREKPYYQENIDAGRYLVAIEQGNHVSDLWNNGKIEAVEGTVSAR